MKYTYTFTREDYENYRIENDVFLVDVQKRIFIYSIIVVSVYLLGSLLISFATSNFLFNKQWWIISTILLVVTTIYINHSFNKEIIRIKGTISGFEQEELELEIFDDKIVETINGDDVNNLYFDKVVSIIDAEDYIGFATKNSTFIIPKRIFELDDYSKFIESLKSKLNKVDIIKR